MWFLLFVWSHIFNNHKAGLLFQILVGKKKFSALCVYSLSMFLFLFNKLSHSIWYGTLWCYLHCHLDCLCKDTVGENLLKYCWATWYNVWCILQNNTHWGWMNEGRSWNKIGYKLIMVGAGWLSPLPRYLWMGLKCSIIKNQERAFLVAQW